MWGMHNKNSVIVFAMHYYKLLTFVVIPNIDPFVKGRFKQCEMSRWECLSATIRDRILITDP